jgi:hypothetical protein
MSRRQYRRNGTPIGKHKVYALAFSRDQHAQVFKIAPHGIETYEDLEGLVMLEAMTGRFGAHERLVVTKPGADLRGTDLYGADLIYANLSGARIEYANLTYANLSGANLSGANLSGSIFINAILRGTNMRSAKIIGADLNHVIYNKGTTWPTGFTPPPPQDVYLDNRRR